MITNTAAQLQQTICSNTALSFLPTSNTGGATTYTWTSSFTGSLTGVSASGSNTITDTPVNSGNTAGVITYAITPKFNTCFGSPVNFLVTVNPIPNALASNQIICSGQTTNITIINPNSVSGTSYNWIVQSSSNVSGASGGSGASINQLLSSSPVNATGSVTYAITPVANGCNGTTITASVTINPVPDASVSNQVICSTGSTNIILNNPNFVLGTKYTWTVAPSNVSGASNQAVAANGPIAQTLTATTNAPGSATYTITPVVPATGCAGTPVIATVTVNPIPTATASNQAICSFQLSNVLITAAPANVGGTTYTWIVSIATNVTGASGGSGATISQLLRSTDGIASGSVTYAITPSANGCAGSTTLVTVTVAPTPVITNTAAQLKTTICSATALNFTATSSIVGTTYTWASSVSGTITGGVSPSGGGAITDSPVNTGNATGTVTYAITPSFGGCPGAIRNYVVTVNPVPTASASNQIICSGQTSNITITNPNSVSGTSFNWIIQTSSNVTGASAGGGNSINQVLSSTDGITSGSVTYAITPAANSCNGLTITASVTVNPVPVITNTAPQLQITVCSSTALNFTPTSTIGATVYNWTSTIAGTITGVTAAASGAITDTPVNTGNLAGTVTYHIIPSVGTCAGLTKDYTVTVEPVPSANGSNIIICSGQNANILINASPKNVSGTTYSWIVMPSANVSGAVAGNGSNINQTLTLTDYVVGSVIYRITPTAFGCNGPTKDITVTINPIPLADAGVDYAVCQPATIALSGTIGGAATSGTWIISTGAGTISASVTSGTTVTATYTVVGADIATTAVFKLITNVPTAPCVAALDLLNVAIDRAPTVVLPADYVVCEPSTISLTGTIGGSALTGLWSIVTGNGTLSATNISGSTVTASYAVVPSDVSTVVKFKLTTNDPDGAGPCVPGVATINITINQAAQVFAPANLALCRNLPGIALGGSIGGSTVTTVWSGGTGSFSNVNNPNATYTFNDPSEVNTTVVLKLTALDPDGAGPCGPVFTTTNLKINPLPVVVFSGFPPGAPPQMAENNAPITLTGNQIGGLFTVSPATSNIGSTAPSPVDKASFDPSAVTLGLNTVTYTYTDVNSCTNSNSQNVIINPVTTIDFTVQTGFLDPSLDWEICADQNNSFAIPNPSSSLILLNGKPKASTGGAPETGFVASVGLTNPANIMNILHIAGEYYIETNGLPADTYSVTYSYKNSFSAISIKTYAIIVHAGPTAGISVANNCIASAINFNDASAVNPAEPIVSWRWDFNDGSASVFAKNPNHTYSIPKVYKVLLQVTTAFGCSDTVSKKVRVGAVPSVKFKASSICNNDSTKFKDFTNNPGGVSRIVKFTWDFGDGSPLLIGDSTSYGAAWNKGNVQIAPMNKAGSFKNPYHHYVAAITYNPKLIVDTNDGCTNTYQKNIFILPYSTVTPLPTSAYREDFEATNGAWQVESLTIPLDSSWLWTVPNGLNINTGTKSWWTGQNSKSYNITESSVVNGPCFNLSSLSRPMISLDYWINTPNSNDGASLQYSTDGGNSWVNIGVPLQGINWYSQSLIVSNPGNQPVGFGPYGWSGASQTKWVRGSFNLDALPVKRDQVRIRVAFAGDASKNIQTVYNGFAFDNVFLGDKTKNVLVEHFTNANLNASVNADTYFNNLYNNQITFRSGSTDFNDIQYHVRFPQPDVFNAGSNDPAGRALYYGVQQAPFSVMDGLQAGKFSTGDYTKIDPVEIDRRALKNPQLTILKIDTTASAHTNHSINASVQMMADTTITFPLLAQVALVESPVIVSGSTNPGTYYNVVRKLLYGSDGITKSVSMIKGDLLTLTKGEVEIDAQVANPTKLFLVAFVQNFTTKEIVQSLVMPVSYKKGSLITGIEDPAPTVAALESIQLYPNPANGKFSLGLPGDFPNGCIWKIADQRGINVMAGDFKDAIGGVKTVEVSSLSNGVYFVAIGAPDRKPVYKKLVVLNAN